MFLIRRAQLDDLGTLLKLAKMVYFINLPPDKDIIAEKIRRSISSFSAAVESKPIDKFETPPGDRSAAAASPLFMFCLTDTDSGATLGTSSIISRMGGPGRPNVSLQLRVREFFSKDLQAGATHTTAQLFLDETGPTEIGGLIMQPSYRGHPSKLGKQIALIRFHFMGLFPEYFSDKVIAEMMGPITPDGHNTLWEYLGRRFINLTYTEADRFCQYSREFMTSLFPREEIYLTLLPPEARTLIGHVGSDTAPARRMLEGLGFSFTDKVDPFDGGPHLECDTRSISVVKDTRRSEFTGVCAASAAKRQGFVSVMLDDADFRALHTTFAEDDNGAIRLTKEAAGELGLQPGMSIGVTPLDLQSKNRKPASSNGKQRRAKIAS